MVLWFKPQGEAAPRDIPDSVAFADEGLRRTTTEEAGAGDLPTGPFRDFSAAEASLVERLAALVPAAARTIVARLSKLEIGTPARPASAETIADVVAVGRGDGVTGVGRSAGCGTDDPGEGPSELRTEHPLVWREQLSPPTWLRSAGTALLPAVARVPVAARAILARLSRPRLEIPLVRREPISPPRWRRPVGAAVLLRS